MEKMNGSSQAKNRFLNLLLKGGRTDVEVLGVMRMGRRTLARWMKDPVFKRAYREAIWTLEFGRRVEVVVRAEAAGGPPGGSGVEGVGEVMVREEREEREERGEGVVSERERLIQLRGAWAGEAFDALRREGEG